MNALRDLAGYYVDRRKALSSAGHGRPVVGTIGTGIPLEIVIAAGALPVAITPGPHRPTPHADEYIEPTSGWSDRDLLEAALTGELAEFDLIVLTQEHQHLFYYLKELYRRGDLGRFPQIAIFDVLPSCRNATETYNRREFELLKELLERLGGLAIDGGTLDAAIGLVNKVRAAHRGIETMRAEGRLGGGEALALHGAAAFMDPAFYIDGIKAVLADPPPQQPRGPGILVTSAEPLSHRRLHDVVEGAGAWVFAEDDQWGSRGATDDIEAGPEPFAALIDSYLNSPKSVGSWPVERAHAWFAGAVSRPQVAGVIFYAPLSDATMGWDIPHLARLASAASKPTMLLQEDLLGDEGRAAAATKVAAWLRDLGAGDAS